MTARLLVTTVPFGLTDPRPRQLLAEAGLAWDPNPYGRSLTESEMADLIAPYEVLIAGGADPITETVLRNAPHLRLVARTGIGLDNVDLNAARRRGVLVTYTPDAPAPAVSELTIGHMLTLLRHAGKADRGLRAGHWKRWVGRRLAEVTVGIIGVGRVGRRVLQHLQGFGPPRVLLNDLRHQPDLPGEWVEKETIWREADVITLHVPSTPLTRGLVDRTILTQLRPDAILINTSRGEILREADLFQVLQQRPDLAAALDVYTVEPYRGPLTTLDNLVLSCHMGSCTVDCRLGMESGAAEQVVRYVSQQPLTTLVPDEEYALQADSR